jgi:hypothetical protein
MIRFVVCIDSNSVEFLVIKNPTGTDHYPCDTPHIIEHQYHINIYRPNETIVILNRLFT